MAGTVHNGGPLTLPPRDSGHGRPHPNRSSTMKSNTIKSTVLRHFCLLILFAVAAPMASAQEPQRIACVGDSITEGNANPDYLTNSWPLILGRLLEAHGPGAFEVGNFGRSGATLLHTGRKPYRDQDVYGAGLGFQPDRVIINLGTNDGTNISWSDAGAFERNLRELVGDFQGLESQPQVWLSNLTPIFAPYPKEEHYVARRVEIEAVIEKVAGELGLKVIDFKTPLLGKPELHPDGLHPNTAGHELMASAMFEALTGAKSPGDASLRPKALDPETTPTVHPVRAGKIDTVNLVGWAPGEHGLEGTGKGTALISKFGVGSGDFHLKAKLRMLGQKNSAAGFALGKNFFGFEGASGTVFRNGPNLLGLKLLHPANLLWKRDAWINFEVIRNGSTVWFLVDGFICEMATIEGAIEHLAFEPMRSQMQLTHWSITGDVVKRRPAALDSRSVALPWVDAVRGSKLDPQADWKPMDPESVSASPSPHAIISRSDGSVFELAPMNSPVDLKAMRIELHLEESGQWAMGEAGFFGDWKGFPDAVLSRLACTPMQPDVPLVCIAQDQSNHRPLALSSDDEGRTWSKPFELPAAITGRGHHALNLPGGRLGLVFMDRLIGSPTRDDLVLWVGTHSDLIEGREGQWTARLFPDSLQMDTGFDVADVEMQTNGEFSVDLIRSRGIENTTRTLTFRFDELEAKVPTRGFDIPIVDLDQDEGRHVVVDREEGQYLGHVTTSLLPDGKTILAVYPKGHGKGPIVYKRSPDGGNTWSERLPTPASWETSQEVPTIHRLIDPRDGTERLIVWSGLYPAKRAYSEDDGATWSELEQVGDWGGIVVMGFVEQMKDGSYIAMFHDDGRFFRKGGQTANPVVFTLFKTSSHDGGLTWSEPNTVWSGSNLHLCEPGIARSPDGKTLAVLLRENSRRRNSHVIFSADEGTTWSAPRELPASLTGDRHTTKYAPDGRLFICFRDTALESPTQGDWFGWVGTFDDILNGNPGQYRIRFKDNLHRWDTTYPGVECLPDGTFVVTTYGHWEKDKSPYILSARFTLDELDKRAGVDSK